MHHPYSNEFAVLGKALKKTVPQKQVVGSAALISAVSNIVAMKQVRRSCHPRQPLPIHFRYLLEAREELGLLCVGCGPFPKAKESLTSTSDLASSASGSWEVSQLLL